MSGINSNNNSNSTDPRFSQQNRPFQSNLGYRPPPGHVQGPAPIRGPAPIHGPGSVPPFIDPRHPNMNANNFPGSTGRHPIPPLRFPGQPPQQFPGPGMVHQSQHQFQNMSMHMHHPPMPTGAAFHTMVQSQNMYPIRTSSGGSNSNSSSPSSPSVTSPTQPPSRKLPPIPVEQDNTNSGSVTSEGDNNSICNSNCSTSDSNPDRHDPDRKPSLRSGLREIRREAEALQVDDEKVPGYIKSINKGVDVAIATTATVTTGTALMNQGMTIANKVLQTPQVHNIVANIEKNPVLNHLVQLADKLVDIGKTVPFIAPAFVILKLIIDVEQKARDADAKCNDLLERINFMVSNITVLEKVKAIDPLMAVITKMNDTLKQAASLIQAYRRQGPIARRLNMSNSQNFIHMAGKISACSQDLMLSLQIQQTGDISVLSRSVPVDPQDEEAKTFVMAHGGQSVVNNDPALVEEFAKKMHLTMSDQVMEQMQTSMEDLLEENQTKIEALLKENSSNTIAETIKAMAAEARELEVEQRLVCLQCNKEYRKSANGPEACAFHKSTEINGAFSCCGKTSPCTYSSHRSAHHCEYPYTNFYDYAYNILGFTDTRDEWTNVSERDLLTDNEQKASVSALLRWRSHQERIIKPMMIIHVGHIRADSRYYLQAFDAESLKATNAAIRDSGKVVIFRTSESEKEYAMAEWTVDDAGTINGVRLTAKVETDDIPTVSLVPIDIETVSHSGNVQTISKASFKVYKPSEAYKFPDPVHVGHVLRSKPLRETREFKAKTKLPLVVIPEGKMVANAQGKFVRNNADKFQGTLRIFNKAPPTSQTFVTLASCKAEFRFVGEDDYKEVESLDLAGVKFPASVGPTQTLDVPFEAIVPRNGAQAALMENCWYWAMVALHHPIRIRMTFKDIEGEELVFVQEYIHKPLGRMAVREDQDLLFLHIDDALDASRSAIRVKNESDDHVLSIHGQRYTIQQLHKIVYKAEQNGVTEVDMNCGRDNGSYKWSAWALVDLSCRRVYGIKVLLTQGSSREKKTTAALGYAACPIYGEGELEERPIQYADEKVTFPELEPEELLHVVVDDDIDDEKVPPVAVIQSVAPVVAIATATSASVTEALSEVSKNAGSLDSSIFAASMSTLEKRLESLDTNVARMATALERLVDILSH
ncbi:hypothetical protein BGX28_006981 [Mortierella sp. GBA30]|nr:hypothetical protein BGX28_006981 [Mortierella sp. GBA30]